MRLARVTLTLVCLMGLGAGLWSPGAVEAQQPSPSITREGTVVSIDRAALSFVMSMTNGSPRQMTVLAQKFTEIFVVRQGVPVRASFASLAVGDRVVVQMLVLATGQAVAVTAQVFPRGTSGSVPAGHSGGSIPGGAAAATAGPGGPPTSSRSNGSSSSAGSGSNGGSPSAGTGVSVGANGSGSSGGSGVSAGASGSVSSSGGISAGANGSGSSGGRGASVGASGTASSGGVSAGVSAATSTGQGANAGASAGSGGVSAGANR